MGALALLWVKVLVWTAMSIIQQLQAARMHRLKTYLAGARGRRGGGWSG